LQSLFGSNILVAFSKTFKDVFAISQGTPGLQFLAKFEITLAKQVFTFYSNFENTFLSN